MMRKAKKFEASQATTHTQTDMTGGADHDSIQSPVMSPTRAHSQSFHASDAAGQKPAPPLPTEGAAAKGKSGDMPRVKRGGSIRAIKEGEEQPRSTTPSPTGAADTASAAPSEGTGQSQSQSPASADGSKMAAHERDDRPASRISAHEGRALTPARDADDVVRDGGGEAPASKPAAPGLHAPKAFLACYGCV